MLAVKIAEEVFGDLGKAPPCIETDYLGCSGADIRIGFGEGV